MAYGDKPCTISRSEALVRLQQGVLGCNNQELAYLLGVLDELAEYENEYLVVDDEETST